MIRPVLTWSNFLHKPSFPHSSCFLSGYSCTLLFLGLYGRLPPGNHGIVKLDWHLHRSVRREYLPSYLNSIAHPHTRAVIPEKGDLAAFRQYVFLNDRDRIRERKLYIDGHLADADRDELKMPRMRILKTLHQINESDKVRVNAIFLLNLMKGYLLQIESHDLVLSTAGRESKLQDLLE